MKKVISLLLVLLLVVFAGCETSSSSGKKSSFELGSYRGGDKAVEFSLAENAPPETVRDQGLQPFSVRVMVENVGEYDIEQGNAHVVLNGFDSSALGLSDNSKDLNYLRGYKKQGSNTIPGGKEQVIFSDLKYLESVNSGTFDFNFFVDVCYPYRTVASALFCINGNTIPAIDEKTQICDLEEKKKFSNSGGPIQITNVEQFPHGEHSVQIQFDIVHKHSSTYSNVYEPGILDSNCKVLGEPVSSFQADLKKDKVKYTVESSIRGLNCESTGSNSNVVTLSGDTYTVTCIQDTEGQSEHEKLFTIKLDYDYFDRLKDTIKIDHIER